jgi:hypothetical protein
MGFTFRPEIGARRSEDNKGDPELEESLFVGRRSVTVQVQSSMQ